MKNVLKGFWEYLDKLGERSKLNADLNDWWSSLTLEQKLKVKLKEDK